MYITDVRHFLADKAPSHRVKALPRRWPTFSHVGDFSLLRTKAFIALQTRSSTGCCGIREAMVCLNSQCKEWNSLGLTDFLELYRGTARREKVGESTYISAQGPTPYRGVVQGMIDAHHAAGARMDCIVHSRSWLLVDFEVTACSRLVDQLESDFDRWRCNLATDN